MEALVVWKLIEVELENLFQYFIAATVLYIFMQASPTDNTYCTIVTPLRSKTQFEVFQSGLAKLPTIKEKEAFETLNGLRDQPNPFLKLSMDVFR